MQILLFNLSWMLFNIILAMIPIVFGIVMVQNKNLLIKLASFTIWFFFLPNTIYLLTDFMHLFEDARQLSGIYLIIDAGLYITMAILGVVTFILAIDPFERILLKTHSQKKLAEHKLVIYGLNFLVGFGLVLGRIHRVNSWEVVTDTGRVIYYTLQTISSLEFMFWVLIFAVLSQVVYLRFRNVIPKIKY